MFQKENQDVKSNSSNMTDAQAGMGKKASDGAGDKKAEGDSPKKKLAAVYRPQNSQQRPTQRPQNQQRSQQSSAPAGQSSVREAAPSAAPAQSQAAGRDGRGQGGFSGNRDGRSQGQGGFGGNRSGSGRQGQRDGGAKNYDTPIQTKPSSNRQVKNAHKNDRYDKTRNMEDGAGRKGGKVSKHPFIMPQKPVAEKVEETIKVSSTFSATGF